MATLPTMGPAEIVTDQYTRSRAYAETLQAQVSSVMDALTDTTVETPTIDVKFDTSAITEPELEALPAQPDLGTYAAVPIAAPSEDVSALQGVTDGAPVFDVPAPVLNIPRAPEIRIGQVPTIPSVREVALPDAPELEEPTVPQMLQLRTPTMTGIDQHLDWRAKLEHMPVLDLLRPEPLRHQRGRAYESQLLEALKATLLQRMRGGTGLSPEVEAALWGRTMDREARVLLDAEADALRANESLGFPLPQGVIAQQIDRLRRDFREKMSGLNRDISIEQAKLEQSNLQQVVSEGLQLESKLMDNAMQLEQQSFEIARATADSMLQVYNAGVREFELLLQQYNSVATVYRTLIESENLKLEQLKAELQAEQTKAQINQQLVAQYEAQIKAQQSRVDIYRAQLDGARAQMGLEEAKLQAAGEQVRAFVATISAETAKLDLHKQQMAGEQQKVDIYKVQADVFTSLSSTHNERVRTGIAAIEAQSRLVASRYDGFRALVQADASRAQAHASSNQQALDSYRAAAAAGEAQANMTARIWQAKLAQYQAGVEISANAQRNNAAFVLQAQGMNQEVAKVGAQTLSQLLASAWNVVSTSATTSGGVTESHSYSHDTE